MSNAVWFNCGNGVAGDMLMASLVDAGADRDAIATILQGLNLDGWALMFEEVSRAGVVSTQALVVEHHGHDDDHHHHDHHHHRLYSEIVKMLEAADIPIVVRERALHAFAVLAVAEAAVHGTQVEDVEFHEVGSIDSIVDIVGVCAALEVLGIDYISCSPIAIGYGTTKMEHGDLPNPGPAVARMVADHAVPIIGVNTPLELSTPTGVALMIALATEFGAAPSMTITGVGHGAGSRDTPDRANVVQALVGLIDDHDHPESLTLLETNVDDISPEVVAYTISRLMELGALDAWATSITMKKGREALTISCLCEANNANALKQVMLDESGSLGVRISTVKREALPREMITVEVDGHSVRIKVGPSRAKVEFEDAASVARTLGLPLREVIARAEAAYESVR